LSLVEVRIRDLAVFDEALVPFDGGFTALTGETGAGKSVCITALRLALGGRVDGDPVRAGADVARVSAVFDELPAALRLRLTALGVPADELVTLSREISRAGRGSCRVNGALVSQAVLREVGEGLAEVTLQGASQRLLQRGRQRDLLDVAAAAAVLRDDVRQAVAGWRAAQGALDEARRRQAAGASEVEAARQLAGKKARVCFVYPAQELGMLLATLSAEGLHAKRLRFVHGTPEAPARVALVEAQAGRPGGLHVTPPLVERGPRGYTPEMQALLARG